MSDRLVRMGEGALRASLPAVLFLVAEPLRNAGKYTLGDILEGHKAGVRTIAVDFGFHGRDRLEKGEPFKIVSSFEEVMEEIRKA